MQNFKNLKANVMTKSKKCPTLVITHNLIGPYNKVFQNLPPFFLIKKKNAWMEMDKSSRYMSRIIGDY
jgi:hypothetical protein